MTKKPRTPAASPARPLAKRRSASVVGNADDATLTTLVTDLGRLIDGARQQAAVAANAALTTLYWQIGTRVRVEVLDGRRAEYGAEIVSAVGRQLEQAYGRSRRNPPKRERPSRRVGPARSASRLQLSLRLRHADP